MTTNSKQIGLIGAGGMGSFHARTLAALPNVSVVAIADPFGSAAADLAAEIGAEAFNDPIAVAVMPELDGVVIASPDDTHAELSLAAMQANTRVLCEKPLATSVADCQRVIDFETQAGQRLVQIGFMREYDIPHVQVGAAIAEGGQIHLIRCVHRNTNADSRSDATVLGQSVVHDLHTIRFLSGDEITAVSAFGTRRRDGGLRHALVVCELAGDGQGVVEFDDDGFAYEVTVDVTTDRGTVSTAPPVRPTVRADAAVRVDIGRDWFGWFADAYRAQDAAWIKSLDQPAASGPSAWDGLVAQAVVEAALDALAQQGRVAVELPERPSIYAMPPDA